MASRSKAACSRRTNCSSREAESKEPSAVIDNRRGFRVSGPTRASLTGVHCRRLIFRQRDGGVSRAGRFPVVQNGTRTADNGLGLAAHFGADLGVNPADVLAAPTTLEHYRKPQ